MLREAFMGKVGFEVPFQGCCCGFGIPGSRPCGVEFRKYL